MAELVDALGSGPSGGNTVEVRVLFWAPSGSCSTRGTPRRPVFIGDSRAVPIVAASEEGGHRPAEATHQTRCARVGQPAECASFGVRAAAGGHVQLTRR